jgi:hypothetical protein
MMGARQIRGGIQIMPSYRLTPEYVISKRLVKNHHSLVMVARSRILHHSHALHPDLGYAFGDHAGLPLYVDGAVKE